MNLKPKFKTYFLRANLEKYFFIEKLKPQNVST